MLRPRPTWAALGQVPPWPSTPPMPDSSKAAAEAELERLRQKAAGLGPAGLSLGDYVALGALFGALFLGGRWAVRTIVDEVRAR